MRDSTSLLNSLRYIERNINESISAEKIAKDAGLLHDIIFEKTNVSLEEVRNKFSERVVDIIKATTEFKGYEDITDEDVIMIKLADRLHNMRTIEFMDEKRWREKAKETLDIFLPIAGKLNNEKMIAELNDLSLRYM